MAISSALIAGGLALGSAIISGISQTVNTNKVLSSQGAIQSQTAKDLLEEREYNSLEAQKNRDWQEKMANTSYQRAVKDLESAGLNPYLAFSQGGAVTPSGATTSHSGISSSRLTSSMSMTNTLLNNQTARDNAMVYAVGNVLTSVLRNVVKK